MKNIHLLALSLTIVLFIGCNGNSSSTPSTQAGSAAGTSPADNPSPTSDTPQATEECTSDGNVVVIPNEGICKDNEHTLTCNLGTVSYDNVSYGETAEIEGRTYSCE